MPFRFPRLLLLSLLLSFPAMLWAQSPAMVEHRQLEAAAAARRAENASRILPSANDYDVKHYRLDVTARTAPDRFRGSVATLLESRVPSLTTVDLNLAANGTCDSVVHNGTQCAFTHTNGVLSITLDQPLLLGQTTRLWVYYSAAYAGSGVTKRQVQNVDLNESIISLASQAEPYDARTWWPCKDDPSDKADSLDLFFTTDEEMFPVGNGVMIDDRNNGDGTRTVHWSSHYPIATYLISIAAAKYNHNTLTFSYDGIDMPMESWYYGMASAEMRQHERTAVNGLKVYSDLFGTYPFIREKYGMAEYEWGGAMEHQTVTSMGFYDADVVVHELAHQWFGDKVTCATFEHIWLNEGWATYCEALFHEASGGLPALKAKMATAAYFGNGTIFVNDPEGAGFNRIFNSGLSYNKGSWIVHMLRHVVGDTHFFSAVRKYLGGTESANYRSVVTKDFQGFLEAESGMNLETFFQNWIYGEYFPTYRYGWKDSLVSGRHLVTLTIRQLESPATQIFDMPIDITFRHAGGDTTIVIRNNQREQAYQFTFDMKITGIQLDRDEWILKRVVSDATLDEGLLLVNGVDWDVSAYTDDIKAAYADSTFTGTHDYRFWDIFPNPAVGYPPNVTPYGIGNIPADEIGRYCTIVWIANSYNGDNAIWQNAMLWDYISQGGNVILLTRMGHTFITGDMQRFLGVSWLPDNTGQPLECRAARADLVDMDLTGEQTLVTPVATTLTRPENELLFTDSKAYNPPRGLGVRAMPQVIDGRTTGQMVYIALRPYRIRRPQLKQNMQKFLDAIVCSNSPSGIGEPPAATRDLRLGQNYPNPVERTASTMISFDLDATTSVPIALRLFDALGREVRTIDAGVRHVGHHVVTLPVDGLPAGVYTYQIVAGSSKAERRLVVIE